uniref:G_PROTEIN_RECEP_F1_2 domain-containing protein n=1 Tax=Steinernema glaseri TaxID=37863 RepID=A0A1I7ZVT8_9BILA
MWPLVGIMFIAHSGGVEGSPNASLPEQTLSDSSAFYGSAFPEVAVVCSVITVVALFLNVALLVCTLKWNELNGRLSVSAYCIFLLSLVNLFTAVVLVPPFLFFVWTGSDLYEDYAPACSAHAILSLWAKSQASALAFLLAIMRVSLWCGWEKPQKEKGFVAAAVVIPVALSALDVGGTALERHFEYDPEVRHCVVRASFVFSDLFASSIFAFISYETIILLNVVIIIAVRGSRRCLYRLEALLFLAVCALSPLLLLQQGLLPPDSLPKGSVVPVIQTVISYAFTVHGPLALGGSYFVVERQLLKRRLDRTAKNKMLKGALRRKKTVREELMNADMNWWINFYASDPPL